MGEVLGILATLATHISPLSRMFVRYLSRLHRARIPQLKALLDEDGGWPLHLDTTGEAGRGTTLVVIAGWRRWVLCSRKIATERADLVLPCLRQTVRRFGPPCAAVRDLGKAVTNALDELVSELELNIPVLACHQHFLADVGKDLLEPAHAELRTLFRRSKIRPNLRALIRELGRIIGTDIDVARRAVVQWQSSLEKGAQHIETGTDGLAVVRALAQWTLDAMSRTKGLDFPFERPYLTLHGRSMTTLRAVDAFLCSAPPSSSVAKALRRLRRYLEPVDENIDHLRAFQSLSWPDILEDLSENVTRVYEREEILVGILVTYCSPRWVPFNNEIIRGWLVTVIIGDSGSGKTQTHQRIAEFVNIGDCFSGLIGTRTGLAYALVEHKQKGWQVRIGRYPANSRKILTVDEAQDYCLKRAQEMSDVYGYAVDVPLITLSDCRNKLARIGAAFAALLVSADDHFSRLVVEPKHVRMAAEFLSRLYSHDNCALDDYSEISQASSQLMDYDQIEQAFLKKWDRAKHAGGNDEAGYFTRLVYLLRITKVIRRDDLAEQAGCGVDTVKRVVRLLKRFNLLDTTRDGYVKKPKFNKFLRSFGQKHPKFMEDGGWGAGLLANENEDIDEI